MIYNELAAALTARQEELNASVAALNADIAAKQKRCRALQKSRNRTPEEDVELAALPGQIAAQQAALATETAKIRPVVLLHGRAWRMEQSEASTPEKEAEYDAIHDDLEAL